MNNNLDKIDLLFTQLEELHHTIYNTGGFNSEKINNIVSFYNCIEELFPLIENSNLNNEEVMKLNFVKNFNRKFESKSISNLQELKKRAFGMKENVARECRQVSNLVALEKENKEIFHKFIKDNYAACVKDRFDGGAEKYYDHLLKDHVFSKISKQIERIKAFERGDVMLAYLDDSVLQNSYCFDRICNAIIEKLHSSYVQKFENANSPEQVEKVKEMLDKKIEKTVLELTERREKSLLENNEDLEKDS